MVVSSFAVRHGGQFPELMESMIDPRLAVARPLLGDTSFQSYNYGGKVFALVSLIAGCGFAISSCFPCSFGDCREHLVVLEPITLMTKHFHSLPSVFKRFRPHSASSQLLRALPPRPYTRWIGEDWVTTTYGVEMPRLTYGVPCDPRGDRTQLLRLEHIVAEAIRVGFRGIDTSTGLGAVHPAESAFRDYYEPAIGSALQLAAQQGVPREEMFIQSSIGPYYPNPDVPIAIQVAQAIEDLLHNLEINHVDSLLLQLPNEGTPGENDHVMEAWRAMETAVQKGLVKQLGIANASSVDQIRGIYESVQFRPVVVQKIFTEGSGLDRVNLDIRKWCSEAGDIYFQPWWPYLEPLEPLLCTKPMEALKTKYFQGEGAIYFRYLMGLGEVPLTSTWSTVTMEKEVRAWDIELDELDAELIDAAEKWVFGTDGTGELTPDAQKEYERYHKPSDIPWHRLPIEMRKQLGIYVGPNEKAKPWDFRNPTRPEDIDGGGADYRQSIDYLDEPASIWDGVGPFGT